jgi:hypothetical protein
MTLIAVAVLAAACSSSSSSSSTTAAKPAMTVYLKVSGAGNKTTPSANLPSTWAASWTFHCPTATSRQPFGITAHPSSGKTVTMTLQLGIGGAGRNTFSGAGTYTFAVATPSTCNWTLEVATPAVLMAAATTTTTKAVTTTTKAVTTTTKAVMPVKSTTTTHG